MARSLFTASQIAHDDAMRRSASEAHSGETDYSTSKYQDADTERAYGIAGEGFADSECGSVDALGWCALVAVDGVCRIIREDSQGFVWTDYAETWHHSDHAAILARWDETVAAYDPAEDDAGDAPHVGHTLRLTGAWYCDTCDSPYCEKA